MEKKVDKGRGDLSILGDAILAERIRKENKHFVVYDKYMLSPQVAKSFVFTSKPTAKPLIDEKDLVEEPPKPRKKFAVPLTTSAAYGWDTEPLMRITDPRFHHPKNGTDITKKYGTCVATKGSTKKTPA